MFAYAGDGGRNNFSGSSLAMSIQLTHTFFEQTMLLMLESGLHIHLCVQGSSKHRGQCRSSFPGGGPHCPQLLAVWVEGSQPSLRLGIILGWKVASWGGPHSVTGLCRSPKAQPWPQLGTTLRAMAAPEFLWDQLRSRRNCISFISLCPVFQ